MKRYTMLKYFINNLEDNDIAIFTGEEMCKEAYQYDRPTNFYIRNYDGLGLSVALGLAMSIDKRVFVFIGEGDLLRQFSLLIQIKASKCANIFVVIVDNGSYQSAGNLPNVMESIKSIKGTLFNIGLVVFDFTVYFNKKSFEHMKNFMKNIRGPMAIIVNVDLGLKRNLAENNISSKDQIERLEEFLGMDTGTSLYEIPKDTPILNINDVRELKIGGSY